MNAYIPVLILMTLGITTAAVVLALTHLCGPKRPNKMKMSVYECGVPPIGTARNRFTVKFYLFAILFLLFDVESVFFYPWAVVYRKYLTINGFILVEMLFFVVILMAAFIYIYKKGALDWD